MCDFLTPEATQQLIKEVDANLDGKINFNGIRDPEGRRDDGLGVARVLRPAGCAGS